MKATSFAIAPLLLLSSACLGAPEPEADSNPDDLASLQLALTGTDADANEYRLRNASFRVSGYAQTTTPYGSTYVDTSISSEDSVDEPFLTARLFPGSYTVTLENADWYLERVTAAGTERIARSVLLSQQSQYITLAQGGRAELYFQFGAGGDLIDFRHGDLSIGISVERAPDTSVDAGAAP